METAQTHLLMLLLPVTLLTLGKETITTHNTNRHSRVHFCACVGQPLSKRLYVTRVCGVGSEYYYGC